MPTETFFNLPNFLNPFEASLEWKCIHWSDFRIKFNFLTSLLLMEILKTLDYLKSLDRKRKCKLSFLLLPSVNFINILCVPFSYKIASCSFSQVTFWQNKHFRAKNVQVKCWWNWLPGDNSINVKHTHFLYNFFAKAKM